jgi:hypothetical protein
LAVTRLEVEAKSEARIANKNPDIGLLLQNFNN